MPSIDLPPLTDPPPARPFDAEALSLLLARLAATIAGVLASNYGQIDAADAARLSTSADALRLLAHRLDP